ncbi:MAG: diguanylate cyclase [Mariprofundus sp.]|nr:diguanylate cyclase [Mariprofundus sp.]
MIQPLKQLLILDDSRDDRLLLTDIIEQAFGDQLTLYSCQTMEEAAHCLDSETVDICLIDYCLGSNETGLTWAAQQLQQRQFTLPPIILLTGMQEMGEIDAQAMEPDSGVTDLLLKSELTPSLLARAIRYAMKQKSMIMKLHKRQLHAALLFDCSREGLLEVDTHGVVIEANHGAERLFGYTPESMIGLYLSQLVDGFSMDDLRVMGRDARPEANSSVVKKVTAHHLHGDELTLELSMHAIQSVYFSLYVISFIDISHHVRIQEELQKQAHTDPLTGLMNRRCFRLRSDREMRRARRSGLVVTLLMLDIDHFKKLNDSYGHEVGDLVLAALAKLLIDGMREMDIFCRWGGEEFLCLLPETDREEAAIIAERMRLGVESLMLSEAPSGMTISIGLAEVDTKRPIKESILRADKALYQAKVTGRNRVVCTDSGDK